MAKTKAKAAKGAPKKAKKATKAPPKKVAKKAAKAPRKKAAKKAKGAKTSAKQKVAPVPKGFATVTAEMCQEDSSATIAFCQDAFGAKLRSKIDAPEGKIMHAELQIGDSIVMLTDSIREPARVSSLFLYVPDVDKTMAKAEEAGATITMPPSDMFWGDRFGRLVDPAGNLWSVATHIEDVSPAEMKKRAKSMAEPMESGESD